MTKYENFIKNLYFKFITAANLNFLSDGYPSKMLMFPANILTLDDAIKFSSEYLCNSTKSIISNQNLIDTISKLNSYHQTILETNSYNVTQDDINKCIFSIRQLIGGKDILNVILPASHMIDGRNYFEDMITDFILTEMSVNDSIKDLI
jgi:hypothetical protein